ncbi:MAG: alpha-D-ribose 1-methylphosphonate 5-triphosphate diphosphatase [Sphingomonadaceae bacterium]
MDEIRIFSQQVVTADACGPAEIVVRDGIIVDMLARPSASDTACDWGDDLLIPGLVDIHTDNLEKHYEPRPGATWDNVGAVMAHDGQCATAGITTVFDSLSFHSSDFGGNRAAFAPILIKAIDDAAAAGLLRVEHLLHLRCEVTNPDLLANIAPHLDSPRVKMLSVMDHRPGQRQLHQMKTLVIDGVELPEPDHDEALCDSNRAAVAAIACARGIALAAHDDQTPAHVEEAAGLGCTIAEFPVTEVAARLSRDHTMLIAMGAPNFVRGASSSGNLSARETAALDLLDILASDYIPMSMIRSAFMLTEAPFNWPLPRAIATVSTAPAQSAGLTDRGAIARGLRADLVRVAYQPGGWPRPVEVWSRGVRIA